MKKIIYQAPETKVIELNLRSALLQTRCEKVKPIWGAEPRFCVPDLNKKLV